MKYSPRFDEAFDDLMDKEDGYVNDPDDPGGETNYGISKKSYPDLDIRKLTCEDAKRIYFNDFWLKNSCDYLHGSGAFKYFDLCVNMGSTQATHILQRAIRACTLPKELQHSLMKDFKIDGIMGYMTISRFNEIATNLGISGSNMLIASMRSEAAGIYRQLAAQNPSQQKFLEGWLQRAYS
jgi:lysozyme family protein